MSDTRTARIKRENAVSAERLSELESEVKRLKADLENVLWADSAKSKQLIEFSEEINRRGLWKKERDEARQQLKVIMARGQVHGSDASLLLGGSRGDDGGSEQPV